MEPGVDLHPGAIRVSPRLTLEVHDEPGNQRDRPTHQQHDKRRLRHITNPDRQTQPDRGDHSRHPTGTRGDGPQNS